MPICFGIKEFAIITGLRCHHAVQPLPIVKPKNTTNKTKKVKGKEKIADDDDLVDIVGKSYRSTNLLTDLESKTLSSKHKESLRLVWFVHAILWAKDTKQVIPTSLLKLSQDREEFNNYPWGHESYNLTVKYLLQKLGHLKPFRTSDSKSRTTLKRFLIQGSLDGCLPRTTKKRMLSTCSPLLMMHGGGDELDDVAHHSVFENGIDHDDASPSLCATCQCKSCNERRAELVNRIHALTEAVNNLAPKRGINPSKMISNSCIPIEIRKRKTEISKALSTIKVISKVVNPLPRPAVQLELQKGASFGAK